MPLANQRRRSSFAVQCGSALFRVILRPLALIDGVDDEYNEAFADERLADLLMAREGFTVFGVPAEHQDRGMFWARTLRKVEVRGHQKVGAGLEDYLLDAKARILIPSRDVCVKRCPLREGCEALVDRLADTADVGLGGAGSLDATQALGPLRDAVPQARGEVFLNHVRISIEIRGRIHLENLP